MKEISPYEPKLSDDTPWKPLYYTKPLTDSPDDFRTRGDLYIDFAEEFLAPLRGSGADSALSLADWQKWLLRAIFEEKEDGSLRYRRVVIGLPRKNGKSFLASIVQIVNLFICVPGDELYVGATAKDQAKIVFKTVVQMTQNLPGIDKHLQYKMSENTIINRRTGVEFKALGADGGTAQGLGPYISIADEVHEWNTERSRSLWSALKDGSGDRDEAMLIGISTAGSVYDSILGERYQEGVKLSEIDPSLMKSTATGFFWWGASEGDDPSDPEVWKKANPMIAEGLYSIDDLYAAWDNTETEGLDDFLRYRLNMFSGSKGTRGELTWMPDRFFLDKCVSEDDSGLLEGDRIVVGFDGSRKDDSTALVGICVDPDEDGKYRTQLLGIWEKPINVPHWSVPSNEVSAVVDDIFRKYDVIRFYADDSKWRDELTAWFELYGNAISKFPQSGRRMKDAKNTAESYILQEYIKLPDSPMTNKLISHIMNAVERTTNGTLKKRSDKSKAKIDAAIAFIMAAQALYTFEQGEKGKETKKTRRVQSF